jgi:hypothetical protein
MYDKNRKIYIRREKKIVTKLSKNCQKVDKKLTKSCQKVDKKLSKSCQKVVKKLSKSWQKVVKKIEFFSETGRRRRRRRRRFVAPRPGTTLSHLVKITRSKSGPHLTV